MTMSSNPRPSDVRLESRRLLQTYDPALDDADRQPLSSFARTHWKALASWGVFAAFVFAYIVWAIQWGPGYLAPVPDLKGLSANESVTAKISNATVQNQVRTALIGASAGLAFLTTGFFAWRQVNMSRLGQLTDRFTKSIENLGAESSAVRLAGVYGLEQLSADHRFCRPAAQVLTAFVREVPPRLKADMHETEKGAESSDAVDSATPASSRHRKETGSQEAVAHEVQDSATIVIAKGLWQRATNTPINLAGAELPQINLPGTKLARARLSRANLRFADLRGVDLSYADLRDADLTGAYLLRATLNNTNMDGAILVDAWLNEVKGVDASFVNAELSGIRLQGAELTKPDFTSANGRVEAQGAQLIGADFSGADLTDADFSGADLTDADFTDATLNNVTWEGAIGIHQGG